MDTDGLPFLAVLSLTAIAGLAIPLLMVRWRLLGRLSRASLEGGIKYKRTAVSAALSLCILATFSVVVSHRVVVPDSPMYLTLGPSVASWTAFLCSVWLIARASPSWSSWFFAQRAALATSLAWTIALLFVV